MSVLSIIMLLSWALLLLIARLKMSVVIALIITLWTIAAQGHTNGSNLLFYIWLFFMALAILDFIQSKKIQGIEQNETEDNKQKEFNTWLTTYKHHLKRLDNDNSNGE